jgi:TrmH family RNA methyltransferase
MTLSRSDEKLLIALRRRKVRASERLFLAEGIRVAEELLDSGIVLRLAVVSPALEDTGRGRALAEQLRVRGAVEVTNAALARLADTESPQGVLLIGEMPDVDVGVLDRASRVLALDAVQDPGNFGTLMRVADAFGVQAVCALPGTVDAWNPKAVRAAAGSSFRVPVLALTNEQTAEHMKRNGLQILVADAQGEDVARFAGSPRTALVVGNEGAGVTSFWRDAADAVVAVPTPGPVESLNVAVATGIVLYELTRTNRGAHG